MEKWPYKRVLTIAGSDSGGGAGIQADIKTISALNAYATSVITAITAQNTLGVNSVVGVPVEMVEAQIDAVLSDIGTNSIKTGMLYSKEIALCVAKMLGKYKIRHYTMDPVMVSTSGHRLLSEDAVEVLCNELIPMAEIVTPNVPEAEILLGEKFDPEESLKDYCYELGEKYRTNIYLKGGHTQGIIVDGEVILEDYFYELYSRKVFTFKHPKVETNNTHGTGCSLSAAMASFSATGAGPHTAARFAHDYLQNAINEGEKYQLGKGHGPVKHFWKTWLG